MTGSDNRLFGRHRGRLFPLLPASLLMIFWVIPDIWATPLRFPHHHLSMMDGIMVLSPVAWPAAGALVWVVMFLPVSNGLRRWLVSLIGFVAVVVPIGITHPGLPIGRLVGVGGALLCVFSAVFLFRRVASPVAGHIALALLPAGLLAMSIFGVMIGEHSIAYLWSFKAPLCLYLSMWLAAGSLREQTFSS